MNTINDFVEMTMEATHEADVFQGLSESAGKIGAPYCAVAEIIPPDLPPETSLTLM